MRMCECVCKGVVHFREVWLFGGVGCVVRSVSIFSIQLSANIKTSDTQSTVPTRINSRMLGLIARQPKTRETDTQQNNNLAVIYSYRETWSQQPSS